MPTNITDVDTFTAPIQAIADNDPATEANFKLATQGLSNRTRNNKNRIDGLTTTVTAIKTSAYTAATYEVVRVNTAAGVVTITLPTAVGNAGKPIVVKKVDTGTANDVTIDGAGAETIDGAATAVIAASTSATILGALTLVSDGAGWMITARAGS